MERAERRRRLKDDQRRVARGLDIAARDGEQLIALMRVLRDLIDQSREAGALAPLMGFLYDNMVQAERSAPRDAIACRRGCAHCCHTWVSASAPEVLFAAAAIPGRVRETAESQLAGAVARTGGLDFEARDKVAVACPLLVDQVCQVYAARPLTCRTAASADAAACARAFLHARGGAIPTPEFFLSMRAGYAQALKGALIHAGLPEHSYEYNQALGIALARRDGQRAWLAGEDLFAQVQRAPGPVGLDNPRLRMLYRAAFD